MRVPVVLLLLAFPLTSGCKKKQYEAECTVTIDALGVGFDNVNAPLDDAARKSQLDRMTKALETWSTSKDKVTLPDLRPKADALADAVVKRKAALASATYGAPPPRPAPSSSAAARQADLEAQAAKLMGLPDKTLDKTSEAALDANNKAYHAAFEGVMDVCAKM